MGAVWSGLLALVFISCTTPGAEPAPQAEMVASPAAAVNTAILPVSREGEPLWNKFVLRIRTEATEHPDTKLLFLGDSITQGWRKYPALWHRYYGDKQPLNGGIWSDSTQHLLWRLQHGTFGAMKPRLIVLLIG